MSKSPFSIQKSIKDNADELQDFLRDLKNWEKDIKAEDNKLRTLAKQARDSPSPTTHQKADEMKKTEKETTNISSALEKAEKLKEQGNKLYASGQLMDAVATYTEGILLNSQNHLLFANRALTYIKLEKYEEAVADCDESLRLDSNYIKCYLRRAMAYTKLKSYSLAVADYKKVLELEPWNKEAKIEIEKLKVKFEDSKREENCEDIKVSSGNESSIVSTNDKKMKTEASSGIMEFFQSNGADTDSDEEMGTLIDLKLPSEGCETQKGSRTSKLRDVSPLRIITEKPKYPPPPPRTSHQFYLDWKKVAKYSDLAVPYLLSIPGSFFHGVEVDVDQLVEIVHHLNSENIECHVVVDFLQSLMRSRGFYLNLAFLELQQKKEFQNIIFKVEEGGRMNDDIKKIKNALSS